MVSWKRKQTSNPPPSPTNQPQLKIRFGLFSAPQPLTQTLMSSKYQLTLRAFIEMQREAGISLNPWLPAACQLSMPPVTSAVHPWGGAWDKIQQQNKVCVRGRQKNTGAAAEDLDVQVALKMQQRDKFATWQAMTHAHHLLPIQPPTRYRGVKARVEFCQICLQEVSSCEWTKANSMPDPPASRRFFCCRSPPCF